MKKLAKWHLISLFSVLMLILSGCGQPYLSALRPAGEVAATQYDLMKLSMYIMVGVIVIVLLIFMIVIFKFRRKNDNLPKQIEGSHKLEILWTVIPIVLLLILAVPTVSATFKLADVSQMDKKNDGSEGKLVVNVRASLYWWEFEYPDLGVVTSQELVVPTDEKIYFNLQASDVKHAFWIPPVGGKMDTNTDNVNKFWLEFDSDNADEAGNLFYGKCTELCGPSHGLMDFKVKAVSRTEFDQWVKDMKQVKKPEVADTAQAQEGQDIFNKSCIGCHAVTPTQAKGIGPNLTNFGERSRIAGVLGHNEEELKNWLRDPETYKPANKMTGAYGQLTEDQIDALAAYLMGLKVQD